MRAALTLLALVALSYLSPVWAQSGVAMAAATLRGKFGLETMNGSYQFQQLGGPSSAVSITVVVNNLPAGTYGTHIHTWGDVSSGLTAADPSISTNSTTFGRGVGTHFNPAGVNHALFPNETRHAGDIGNIVSNGDPTQTFTFTSDLISLGAAANGIIGRAVIIHSGPDLGYDYQPTGNSGTPNIQGVIGIVDVTKYGSTATSNDAVSALTANPRSALAVIRNTAAYGTTVFGTCQFGFDAATSKVRVVLAVSGLPPNTAHGFHVHTFGDDSDSNGELAGGHFNPLSQPHALPPTTARHVGDMGVVTTDASGNINVDTEFDLLQLIPGTGDQAYSIIGRTVMLHNFTDDGVTQATNGNAGARIALGTIGISNRPMPTTTSNLTPPTAGKPTGTTLCDRLVTALGQPLTAAGTSAAWTTYLTKAFFGYTGQDGLYTSSVVGPYFNSQKQYRYSGDPSSIITAGSVTLVSPDFASTANSVQLNALVQSLATFFGQKTVLGCTTPPGTYQGATNMYLVHRNMNISQGVFTAFNDILIATATAYGLTGADGVALRAGLNSFGRNSGSATEVCQMADCACATNFKGDNCDSTINAASSFVVSIGSLAAAVIVAILAQKI